MKLAKSWIVVMFVALMGIHAGAGAANVVPLVEPGPIAYPTGKLYSTEEIRKSIVAGAMRHQWRVESESPGVVRLILDGRRDQAVLVVDVVYGDKSYSIKYVRSEGLRYVKGSGQALVQNPTSNTVSRATGDPLITTIHSSYARWMKNLTDAINVELRLAKMN
jgi:hypothetical protein